MPWFTNSARNCRFAAVLCSNNPLLNVENFPPRMSVLAQSSMIFDLCMNRLVHACLLLSIHLLYMDPTRISLLIHYKQKLVWAPCVERDSAWFCNLAPCFYAIRQSDWSIQIFNDMFRAVIDYHPVKCAKLITTWRHFAKKMAFK